MRLGEPNSFGRESRRWRPEERRHQLFEPSVRDSPRHLEQIQSRIIPSSRLSSETRRSDGQNTIPGGNSRASGSGISHPASVRPRYSEALRRRRLPLIGLADDAKL